MNIFGAIDTVLNLLPFVQQIISGVETFLGSGNGSTKKSVAVSATIAGLEVYAKAKNITLPATFESDISTAIDANVKVMNDLNLLLPHTTVATA